ncbi:tail assembly protein [Pseudomonas oryzihabitans]|uniref:Phage-related protein, tail component n=1 Tax=Pseudomonas oryzihabitans TaxID=47885 RepID=A0A1G5MWD8_9PSED|nr:tail assembly protein [Pseudomonas psychrotolerans]NMY89833.1 tail assembly protein [Pseudomonas psychrotolerans]SCZ28861.1 Phage-related protein, tail component [Pseudomonas psychrotolerans]
MSTAAHYTPATTIKLSGPLARLFGRTHRYFLERGTAEEAFSALRNTIDGFREAILALERRGLVFAIFRNRENVGAAKFELSGTRELRIVPVLRGSKRGGILQTIVGVVMIVAGIFLLATPFGAPLIAAGIGMVAGGVVQMLSPQPKGLKTSAAPENQPSYAFGSAKNTTASGNPVPMCYGRRRWGGAIISAGIYAEDAS